MNIMTDKEVLVLTTGLFPDAETIEAALSGGKTGSSNPRYEIDLQTMNDEAWDRLLADILKAKTILTL